MSKIARVIVGALLTTGLMAGPAVLGAETASAKNVWCC